MTDTQQKELYHAHCSSRGSSHHIDRPDSAAQPRTADDPLTVAGSSKPESHTAASIAMRVIQSVIAVATMITGFILSDIWIIVAAMIMLVVCGEIAEKKLRRARRDQKHNA